MRIAVLYFNFQQKGWLLDSGLVTLALVRIFSSGRYVIILSNIILGEVLCLQLFSNLDFLVI